MNTVETEPAEKSTVKPTVMDATDVEQILLNEWGALVLRVREFDAEASNLERQRAQVLESGEDVDDAAEKLAAVEAKIKKRSNTTTLLVNRTARLTERLQAAVKTARPRVCRVLEGIATQRLEAAKAKLMETFGVEPNTAEAMAFNLPEVVDSQHDLKVELMCSGAEPAEALRHLRALERKYTA